MTISPIVKNLDQRLFWPAFGSGLLALFALLTLTACPPLGGIESYRVLGDIAASAGPSTLKEATSAPTRHAVAYQVEDRTYSADLYRPGEVARAALVLVPGASWPASKRRWTISRRAWAWRGALSMTCWSTRTP